MKVSQRTYANAIQHTGKNMDEVTAFIEDHDLNWIITDGQLWIEGHNEFMDPDQVDVGNYIVAYIAGSYGAYELFYDASDLKTTWDIEA